MKIIIISPLSLPIPASKGGAIESIIENLILESNIQKNINFIDFSCYSVKPEIGINNDESFNQNYIYVKRNKVLAIFDKFLNLFSILFYKLKLIKVFLKHDHLYLKIARDLTNKDFDYLIFEGGHYTLARYFKRINSKKLIYHLHHEFFGSGLNLYFKKILTVSEFLKKSLLKSSNYKNLEIKTLRNVINENLFKVPFSNQEKIELLTELNLIGSRVILFIGRIIPEKGIDILIDSIENNSQSNIKLLIIGTSNFGNVTKITKFEKIISKKIKHSSNIIYLGFIHNTKLYKYFKIADIFVSPSIYNEAAGLVNLESIASGTPLISTNLGGIPEYVPYNLLIEYNEDFKFTLKAKIFSVLNDKRELNAIKKTIKNFSFENYKIYYNNLSVILKDWKKEDYE
jgi:glycosyltransferase involved in cell wall biosynthesis